MLYGFLALNFLQLCLSGKIKSLITSYPYYIVSYFKNEHWPHVFISLNFIKFDVVFIQTKGMRNCYIFFSLFLFKFHLSLKRSLRYLSNYFTNGRLLPKHGFHKSRLFCLNFNYFLITKPPWRRHFKITFKVTRYT